jgi:glycosyltransferase EpsH
MIRPVPKVSVCVPVYKTEAFIRRCLDSLLAQTLSDIEIVIVNDGSPDGSQRIIEEYAQRDQRIIHMTQPNSGLGATRNAGIKLASGDYVAFVDSDDWVEPDCCEALHSAAVASGADLVVCDYWIEYPDSSGRPSVAFRHDDLLGSKDQYLRAILERRVAGFSWNKLYRRALLVERELKFPTRDELENVEDQYYSLRVVFNAKCVSFLRKPLVHYQLHTSSIVQRYQPTLFRDYSILFERNTALLADASEPWIREALEGTFLWGVFVSTLNECKPTNAARRNVRLATLRRMAEDPRFRRIYDARRAPPGLSTHLRAVVHVILWALRHRLLRLAYALAAAYQASVVRKTL